MCGFSAMASRRRGDRRAAVLAGAGDGWRVSGRGIGRGREGRGGRQLPRPGRDARGRRWRRSGGRVDAIASSPARSRPFRAVRSAPAARSARGTPRSGIDQRGLLPRRWRAGRRANSIRDAWRCIEVVIDGDERGGRGRRRWRPASGPPLARASRRSPQATTAASWGSFISGFSPLLSAAPTAPRPAAGPTDLLPAWAFCSSPAVASYRWGHRLFLPAGHRSNSPDMSGAPWRPPPTPEATPAATEATPPTAGCRSDPPVPRGRTWS